MASALSSQHGPSPPHLASPLCAPPPRGPPFLRRAAQLVSPESTWGMRGVGPQATPGSDKGPIHQRPESTLENSCRKHRTWTLQSTLRQNLCDKICTLGVFLGLGARAQLCD